MRYFIYLFLFLCSSKGFSLVDRAERSRSRQSKEMAAYEYKFAICTMFKNEAEWLREWLAYHYHILKAEHFYLYNNDSTDNFMEVLEPYIQAGIVEVFDWTSSKEEHALRGYDESVFVPYQYGAFTDCMRKQALHKAKWVAVIDVDEFIVPVKGVPAFHARLEEAAQSDPDKKIGALVLNWVIFGTSEVWNLLPGELLIEKLLSRAPLDFEWNKLTKTIYRPEAVSVCAVHNSKLNYGFFHKYLDPGEYRIQHYWTRTGKNLFQKRGHTRDTLPYYKIFNSKKDESILQFVHILQNILGKQYSP